MALSTPNNVLVIGVGGTGKWILTHLKRSLIHANNHWLVQNSLLKGLDPEYGRAIPDGIKLLSLDLDNAEVAIDDVKIDYNQATGNEFINFKNDLSNIKRDVQAGKGRGQWPWFESEDGEDARKLTLPIGGQEEQGAGQQRHFSRLSFLESLRGNARFLNILNAHFLAFQDRHQIDSSITNYFIIVGSIAGGTGSGTMLDIAQVLKYKIETPPALPNSTVLGIAVLSDTFSETFRNKPNQWQLIQANCLAAMREIRRFLVLRDSGYPFSEYDHNWNPNPRVSDRQAPFDVCYVVDGTRPKAQHLTNFPPRETLYPAVADYLSNLCLQNDRPFDPANTRNIIGNTSEGVFSTLGCHTWLFPVDDIIKDFSIQLAQSFVSDIRKPALPTFDWDGATDRFLRNSQDYYSQNAPENEYFKGATKQDQKFGLLDEIAELITDKQRNSVAPSIDFNFFTEKIFAPNNFPLRFADPTINYNLITGCELPTLNLDQSRANETDCFNSNPDIMGTNDQQQVVSLAKKLLQNNLGTSNDTIFDRNNRNLRRTYHSILEYYRRSASEIFGGYQDNKANYYPGLVENQIFLILNRVRQYRPTLDEKTQKPLTGLVTGNPLYEVAYETNARPLDTARQFCKELVSKLQQAKEIIDEAYATQFCSTGRYQVEIDKEEANRREYEYLNAGRFGVIFKKSPYLESMQRFLLSQRLEVLKRTFTAVIEDFVQILNGWLEALNNFDAALSNLNDKLSRIHEDFAKVRSEHEAIKTRSYLSTHQSPFEKNLYQSLIETTIEQSMKEGQAVDISNKDRFNQESFIHIGLNPSDVNTRPGMKRTGRVLSVYFRHEKKEEVLALPEIALKYAGSFCQSVRDVNFWNALIQYRDVNGHPRYRLDQQNLPSLLTDDIISNSQAFINYMPAKRVAKIGNLNDSDLIIYADGATAVPGGINFAGLVNTLIPNGFAAVYNANTQAGQKHQLTAISQIYNLTIDSLHSFSDNLNIYRDWLIHTYITHGSQATGTPLHNYLGEKYASRYEQFIMNNWQALGLKQPVHPDFFLPLGVILTLEKVEEVRDFLWAGVHMKRLYWAYDNTLGDHYAIKDSNGRLIPLASSVNKGFLGALALYTMPSDPQTTHLLDVIKNEVRKNYEDFLKQKNRNRAQCLSELKGYMSNPINNMVLPTGTTDSIPNGKMGPKRKSKRQGTPVAQATTKQIINTPSGNANQMLPEEQLNLLFKAFLYEEISRC